ncbi:MAG: S-layer homology domain-containing protein [Oscillospiraceae bacterium]|nr:S-layer homology domain-containing protein [Oscillospiraceae bacterium]
MYNKLRKLKKVLYSHPMVSCTHRSAKGITNGTGDGLFSPNMTCSHAQMVTFLFRCFAE